MDGPLLSPEATRLLDHAQWVRARFLGRPDLTVDVWIRLLRFTLAQVESEEAEEMLAELRHPVFLRDLLLTAPTTPVPDDVLIQSAHERARKEGRALALVEDLAAAVVELAKNGAERARAERGAPARAPQAASGDTESSPTSPRIATPALDHFGRDLTRLAREGALRPVVGREAEIEQVLEALCRTTKPNPLLVGPAGCGKTAIVEAIAGRVARDEVPRRLQGLRIVEIQPGSVVAGATVVGRLEQRMKTILGEAREAGVILFIDETHSIIGAGRGRNDPNDVASLLKPHIARGDLKIIGATTAEEYGRYIVVDAALARRFFPIPVHPLSREASVEALRALAADAARSAGIAVPESVLERLVTAAERFLPHRSSPDREVDVLEGMIAHALAHDQTSIGLDVVGHVIQRLSGVPADFEANLTRMRTRLGEEGLMGETETEILASDLLTWSRSESRRPLATVLDPAPGRRSARLASIVAAELFGNAERVLHIDLEQVGQSSVWADDFAQRLRPLESDPWRVLHLDGIDVCDAAARRTLARAIERGELTTAGARPIPLQSTLILLGMHAESGRGPAGFHRERSSSEASRLREEIVGPDLARHISLVLNARPPRPA